MIGSGARRPLVVGWGQTEIGRHAGRAADDLALEALYAALDYAELKPTDLDGIVTVPQGYIEAQPQLRSQRFAQQLGVPVRVLSEVSLGSCSALMALRLACMEVASGGAEVIAIVAAQVERVKYGEKMTPEDYDRLSLLNGMFGPQLAPYGLLMSLPCHALCAQRYIYEHGVDPRDVAELAVRLRYNATLNKAAELRTPITVDQVVDSPLVAPPIHGLEAAPWSDGGACLIVMSEERAWSLGRSGPAVVGWGERHQPEDFLPASGGLTEYPWMAEAVGAALAGAGKAIDSVDVVEVGTGFAHSELISYESMGFFKPGEAAVAVKRGDTAIGGQLPINPSGGRLSMGHPILATPLLMVAEVGRQLIGRAGRRQVHGAKLGLVQADHGLMNGGAVCALAA